MWAVDRDWRQRVYHARYQHGLLVRHHASGGTLGHHCQRLAFVLALDEDNAEPTG